MYSFRYYVYCCRVREFASTNVELERADAPRNTLFTSKTACVLDIYFFFKRLEEASHLLEIFHVSIFFISKYNLNGHLDHFERL